MPFCMFLLSFSSVAFCLRCFRNSWESFTENLISPLEVSSKLLNDFKWIWNFHGKTTQKFIVLLISNRCTFQIFWFFLFILHFFICVYLFVCCSTFLHCFFWSCPFKLQKKIFCNFLQFPLFYNRLFWVLIINSQKSS